MIDVLFITRPSIPEDTGKEIYRNIRLHIQKMPANISLLRTLSQSGKGIHHSSMSGSTGDSFDFFVLTPIYIKEFLKKRGIQMEEISCADDMQRIKEYVSIGVRVIAMSTTWLPGINAAEIIRDKVAKIKKIAPDIPLIVGGAGIRKGLMLRRLLEQRKMVGILPEWLEKGFLTRNISRRLLQRRLAKHFLLIDPQADKNIDALVTADNGEYALVDIVNRVREGKSFRDLPNLAIPMQNEYVFNPGDKIDANIDSYAIDWSDYIQTIGELEAPILYGMGCPFRCGFCDFHGLKQVRSRSKMSLTLELQSLSAPHMSRKKVYFIDDNLGANRKRLLNLTESIAAANIDIEWRAFLHVSAIDQEIANKLRNSGCRELLLGMESGDPDVLRNMNKNLDLDKALKSIHYLDSVGIRTQCTFVVGFPGECSKSIDKTAAFISALPSGDSAVTFHRYYLFRFMLSPLSPIAEAEQRKQFELSGIGSRWSHKTMTANEATDAMRELFLRVKGSSHMYLEHLPEEWTDKTIRKIIEQRDVVQKAKLERNNVIGLGDLLSSVREADRQMRTHGCQPFQRIEHLDLEAALGSVDHLS